MSYASEIAAVTVSRSTRTPTQEGFGTPLVAAYHVLYADRVRSYSSLSAMVDDGFTPYDPAYRAASACFAQTPAPPIVKVGRRVLPYTQVVNVTPAAPISGSIAETYTVEVDGLTATCTSDATPTVAEVCTLLAAAINALGDVDAIVATLGSTTGIQTLTGLTLDGVSGGASLGTPRFISFVFSSHADWDATNITLAGLDGNGEVLTESIAIPNGGNATVVSIGKYLQVTTITVPAQSGTGGTATVGVRAPVTASGVSGTHVACTAAAGEFHSYAPATENVSLTDVTANPGLATDLTAINTADSDWYGLLLDSNSVEEICDPSAPTTAAASWVETSKKLFVWQSADAGSLSAAVSSDPFYVTEAAGYVRSAGIYYPSIGVTFAAAAWMGEELPKVEGSSTWMFKALAGVTVYELTDTQRDALEDKQGNHYLDAGGLSITGPGNSASGEWLDVVRDLDWLTARLREASIAVFTSNDKVTFTDEGISLLLAAIRKVLNEAVTKTVLAASPKFTLTAPRAADVSAANKQARHLPSVEFNATLAGAIHSIAITGNVSA